MNITKEIAKIPNQYHFDQLPTEAITIAKQCMLDWLGVTIAALDNEVGHLLKEELADSFQKTTLVGTNEKASLLNATLINGTIGHVLDYDDTNKLLLGHPTAAIFPALLALAEKKGSSGADLITAFVAGYETGGYVASLAWIPHYHAGFHASATIGTFSAAAACSRLMNLESKKIEMALGLASTQAAGLKINNGTMSKSFQVGKAAMNGLLAARMAARGFTAGANSLEGSEGFLQTHTTHQYALTIQPKGYFIKNNLFKYHAACHLTHSEIEVLKEMKAEGLRPEAIAHIKVEVPHQHLKVCNIEIPKTGLETKFSMKHIAAMTLYGAETARVEAYTDEVANDEQLKALAKKVIIQADRAPGMDATVTVTKKDGTILSKFVDVGTAETDLDKQQQKVEAKFLALTIPILGKEKALALKDYMVNLEQQVDISNLFKLAKVRGAYCD